MFRKIDCFAEERKTDILILTVMIKNLYFYFRRSTQFLLNLNYRDAGGRVKGVQSLS